MSPRFTLEIVLQTFANNLRRTRKRRKWTQRQLAEKMGKSLSFVCDYEQCRSAPNLRTLVAFANTLEVSLGELLVDQTLTGEHS